jgi:hypothetical protein
MNGAIEALATDSPVAGFFGKLRGRAAEAQRSAAFNYPMTVRLAFAFGLLLCVGGFGLASTINQFAIVEAVNARLPACEQFDPFWWGPFKILKLHQEYRRLYPDGRLLRREAVLVAVMFVCILLVALLLGLGFLVIAWLGPGFAWLLWFVYFRKCSAA